VSRLNMPNPHPPSGQRDAIPRSNWRAPRTNVHR
jgi:hypothetical protein